MCVQCERSQKTIKHFARLAAVVGAAPIPGADMPVLLAMQTKMVRDIGRHFGHNMSLADSSTMAAGLGAGGLLARGLARQLIKLLPGLGWLISGAVAAAGTRTFGRVALDYFRNHHGHEHEQQLSPVPAYRQLARA